MNRKVTIEELREHLTEHIERVREGDTVNVLDGDAVVATLAPPQNVRQSFIVHEPPKGTRLGDFKPGSRPQNLRTDPAQIIIEEREHERSGKKHQ